MGSLPRLKIKDELNYRKGSTADHMNCRYCLHLTEIDIPGRGSQLRCKIMGIHQSIRYRVREDHRCDAHELDESRCWWLDLLKEVRFHEPL